jgi:S-adenosyl methyltransferase
LRIRGTGQPAPASTHEVAQQAAPDCAVAYVDNDPLVLVYARALLTCRPPGRCGYVDADLRDTATLLEKASAPQSTSATANPHQPRHNPDSQTPPARRSVCHGCGTHHKLTC